MSGIIQLKIKLIDSKPPIWRKVLVQKNITFEELHLTIQLAMGWLNAHLYEFRINKNTVIAVPDEDTVDTYANSIFMDSSKVDWRYFKEGKAKNHL